MKKISLILFFLLIIIFILNNQKFIDQSKAVIENGVLNNNLMFYDEFKSRELTIDEVFKNKIKETSSLNDGKKIVIIVTGDVLLARSVNYRNSTSGNFLWPFLNVASVLRNADITYINLETPLIENCPLANDGMIFCGNPRNVEGLLFAGVDVTNIANNHIYNYGEEGISRTRFLLEKNNIIPAGYSGPVYKNVKGKNIAFIGYSDFNYDPNHYLDNEEIRNEIKISKINSDITVVQFHWGNEYTTVITPRQKSLAYLAIDSGADLVIGNHPHWIQPIEIYKGKLIVYSHGNFIFDQEWSKDTKTGIVGQYTFYENKLIDVDFLPIRIENYGQPYFLEGMEKQDVLSNLHNISK